MRFLYRAIFVLLCLVALISYFYYFNSDSGAELLEPIDDHYGETCLFQGTTYKEGALFELPCKQCYCSFGKIECAVMHCIETGNTLGKDLIKRSIQVMITTEDEDMVGMIALINSILKHTAKPVLFTLVVPLDSVSHLQKWLEGTPLRTAQYDIKGHEDKWWDDLKLTGEREKLPINDSYLADPAAAYRKAYKQAFENYSAGAERQFALSLSFNKLSKSYQELIEPPPEGTKEDLFRVLVNDHASGIVTDLKELKQQFTDEEKKKDLKEDKEKLAKISREIDMWKMAIDLTAFSRLRLGSILPMEHRVIVMDSDMIVQGDISELFDLDLGNHTVAMSSDCHTRTKTTSIFPPYFDNMFDISNPKIKHLALDPTACTFSPSLMVVDLDKWFRGGHEKALLSLMTFLFRNKEVYKLTVSRVMYTLPLLLHFHNDYLDLDPAWNVRNLGYTRNPHYSGGYIEKANLLHWNGRLKPWATWSQLQQIWDQYYLEDPTGLFRLERSEKQAYEVDKGASNPAGLAGEAIKV